jgi:hypothetical protein
MHHRLHFLDLISLVITPDPSAFKQSKLNEDSPKIKTEKLTCDWHPYNSITDFLIASDAYMIWY